MEKYKTKEPIGTSNGFWYDISDGGYIIPADVLVDQEKAAKLQAAIDLLSDWYSELEDDEMIEEF